MTLRIQGGVFRGRILKSPKSLKTRPTTGMVRGAVFNICSEWIPNAKFLDLYAGSGAMGLEAISRGAAFATLIDKNTSCIRENVSMLQIEPQVQILSADVKTVLPRLLSAFDLIYIDPPYEINVYPLLEEIALHNLLRAKGLLFLEERYNPEKKSPTSCGSLSYLESRRYGISYLHLFQQRSE